MKRQRKSRSADSWPSWTDDIRFAPTEREERWASEVFNQGDEGHTSDFPPDEVLEQLAGEFQAIERLERGLSL